ncbi:hypothetical protein V8F44DRAFT_631552 [Aspergillus fumigatus]
MTCMTQCRTILVTILYSTFQIRSDVLQYISSCHQENRSWSRNARLMHSLDIEAATLRNRLEINSRTFIGYSAYPRLSQASMDVSMKAAHESLKPTLASHLVLGNRDLSYGGLLPVLFPIFDTQHSFHTMSSETFYKTQQDLRKAESHASHAAGGNTPANSNVSAMKVTPNLLIQFGDTAANSTNQSIVDEHTDKAKAIEERKANLPLPDQPPVASDWQSADQRAVNVGSGGVQGSVSGESNTALRDPATAGSSARMSGEELHKETQPTGNVGRQATEGLSDIPGDAKARK